MIVTGPLLPATAFIAAGAAGAAIWAYKHELARARDAARRGGPVVETAAGAIEYAEKGAGVPLLSIHGAGGGYDQGLANAAELLGDGFRVIAPSRFGYLRTLVPHNVSPAAQAEAHAALLSQLGVSKAIVLGVSAGAQSAVELAIRRQDLVAALILIAPGTYSPVSPVSVDASRGSKFAFWVVNVGGDFAWWAAEKIAPWMLIRFIGVRPEVVSAAPQVERDRATRLVESIQPLSLRFRGVNVDSAVQLHELPLASIIAPTLIVSARDDLFNTLPAAEFAASKIPNAQLVVYESGGHLLIGHTHEVRDRIAAFLAASGLVEQRAERSDSREDRAQNGS